MAKKKEMNRTSGTARRLTGRSEGIATKLKYGAPLTGSASGVKSISLKDAGEVLTQGIVTLGKKGLKFAPEGLAMALPLGKVAKAAQALGKAGRIVKSAALESRLASKVGRTLQLPDNAEARFKAIDQTFSNLGAFRPAVPGAKKVATFPKRVVGKLPEPNSVDMVKQSFTKGGMKITDKGAKNISRLLMGRVNRGK